MPSRSVKCVRPLQGLRELGNIVALCWQIEAGMTREDLLDLHCSGPFTNAVPKPPFKSMPARRA